MTAIHDFITVVMIFILDLQNYNLGHEFITSVMRYIWGPDWPHNFLTFFFLHTLRHDFVPQVMIFLPTLRHEIITGVMILHLPAWFFGHSVTSLNKQKRGSACKKSRYSILVSLLFTPKKLELPHSCGASGYGPRICMVGPHALVYSLGFVCINRCRPSCR